MDNSISERIGRLSREADQLRREDYRRKHPKKCNIGIIGLGQIGQELAKTLAVKENSEDPFPELEDIYIINRDEEKKEEFEQKFHSEKENIQNTTQEYCTGSLVTWAEGVDCSTACGDPCPEE